MSEDPKSAESLIVNPTLRIDVNYAVSRRGRTEGAGRLRDAALARWVWLSAFSGLPPERVREYKRLGILIPARRAPRPVSFPSTMPRTVPTLLPLGADSALKAGRARLNRGCFWQNAAEPARPWPRALLQRVPTPTGPILWVRDPGSKLLAPYLVDEPVRAHIVGLMTGAHSPEKIPARLRRVLQLAGILTDEEDAKEQRARWRARMAQARDDLKRGQFAVIRGVLNPLFLARTRDYLRRLEREGCYKWAEATRDPMVSGRKFRHNDPLCHLVHLQLAKLLSEVTPEPIKASYSYLCSYDPGSELGRHRDREQCAWNVSMPLDAAPERSQETAWPIFIEVSGQPHEVRLGLGDAVLYRGTQLWHWREPQPAGERSTVCFFHFVPTSFRGTLY